MTRAHLHKLARKGGSPPAENKTAAPTPIGNGGNLQTKLAPVSLPLRCWIVNRHLVVEVRR